MVAMQALTAAASPAISLRWRARNDLSREIRRVGWRAAPVAVTPRAVSIYDTVRGDDDTSRPSTVPSPDSVPEPRAPPTAAAYAAPEVPKPAPLVPPTVISSKAALLASAEDLSSGVDCSVDDEECPYDDEKEQEGIVSWTVKYVDKALDDIEREKPKQAEVAWQINRAGGQVVKNPSVQRGAKLTADVGMEVVKVGMKAAAPVVGNIGKFAAKTAFSAAVSGIKNPLDGLGGEEKPKTKQKQKPEPKKKLVKLTAAEAEERRRQGKKLRKVSKSEAEKRKGFFGL